MLKALCFVVLAAAIFCGSPDCQGGTPMDDNGRIGGGVLDAKQKSKATSLGYNVRYMPRLKLGPHSDNQVTDYPHKFRSLSNMVAIACQIDCKSVFTVAKARGFVVTPYFSTCTKQYYSYGAYECVTPETVQNSDIEKALMLCGGLSNCTPVPSVSSMEMSNINNFRTASGENPTRQGTRSTMAVQAIINS